MKRFLSMLPLLILLTKPVSGNEVTRKKIHSAVTTAITWAEAIKKGNVPKGQELFSQLDLKALAKMGPIEGLQKEMSEVILKERENLSFKQEKDDPSSGILLRQEEMLLPMKKSEDRWVADTVTLFQKVAASAKVSTASQDIASFGSNLEQYKNIGGTYPSTEQGLKSLLKKPNTSPRPRRWVQMIADESAFKDPWGNSYQYTLKDGAPKISSLGPDGKVSDDDISN